MRRLYFWCSLLGILMVLPSCVSRKKHLLEINELQSAHLQQSARLANQINRSSHVIDTMNIQLAIRQGEIIALTSMQNKLQDRIDQLEGMKTQAASQQQNLGSTIRQKDQEIERLKQLLRDVETITEIRDQQVETLVTTLKNALSNFKSETFSVSMEKGKGILAFTTDELFYPGSTSRIQKAGLDMLAITSQILSGYPGMFITVVGHTDNKQPSSSYKDNWNYSTLQASAVVRALTDEFDLARNQVLAAGKGEFSPRASNETPEGRKLNRRIELVIEGREDNLIRELRKKVSEMDMN